MKKIIFLFSAIFLSAMVGATELPAEYYTFRDAVYNCEKSLDEFEVDLSTYIYNTKQNYKDYEQDLVLARFEYIMGRGYYYALDKDNAKEHFERGMDHAKAAVNKDKNAESLLIYAENVNANCLIKNIAWVAIWAPKVPSWDKKILEMDPTCAAALFMLNGQDIYVPKLFCNFKRGVQNMILMLDNSELKFDTDDTFNTYLAIGYSYAKLKDKVNAQKWLEKSLTVYPGNKYVKDFIENLDDFINKADKEEAEEASDEATQESADSEKSNDKKSDKKKADKKKSNKKAKK